MSKHPFTVHGGDFKKGKAYYSDTWFSKKIHFRGFFSKTKDAKDIQTIEIVTDEMVKAGMSKLGAGVLGGLLLGPLGLIAGAVIGGKRKKEMTFIVQFLDGTSFVGSSNVVAFQTLKGASVRASGSSRRASVVSSSAPRSSDSPRVLKSVPALSPEEMDLSGRRTKHVVKVLLLMIGIGFGMIVTAYTVYAAISWIASLPVIVWVCLFAFCLAVGAIYAGVITLKKMKDHDNDTESSS